MVNNRENYLRRDNNKLNQDSDSNNMDNPELNQTFLYKYFINFFIRRKKLISSIFLGIFSFNILITVFERIFFPTYEASFKLLISDPIQTPPNQTPNPTFLDIASNKRVNDIPTLIEVLKSNEILDNVKGGKIKGLDIYVGGGDAFRGEKQANGVLIVSIYGDSKKNTFNLAKSLANEYLNYSVNQKNKRLAKGLDYLDKQLPIQKLRYDSLTQKLLNYKKENSFVRGNSALEIKSSEIEKNILAVQIQRSKLIAAKEGVLKGYYLTQSLSEVIKPSISPININRVGVIYSDSENKLLTRYRELLNEFSLAKTFYKTNPKILKSLKTELQAVKNRVLEEQKLSINNALKLNEIKEKTLIDQLRKLNEKYFEQTELIGNYEKLLQEFKTEQENLIGLREARATFELEMAQNNVAWSLLSKPSLNPDPIFPSFRNNLSFGFVLALSLALFVGFIKEKLDNYYHDENEIKNDFDQVILGSIPHIKELKNDRQERKSFKDLLSKLENVDSFFILQESFRNICTSLKYLSPDRPIKSLSITSSVPSEGKTTNNLLLAKVLCDLGKRVLIVDADMNKPQINESLLLDNIRGLSNLLIDEETKWKDYVQKVSWIENLSVITAGRVPPNTLKILESKKMERLIKDINDSNMFDLIIWDCAPLYSLSDTRVLFQYLDGIILQISCGVVDRQTPKECIEIIKNNKINCLGLLVSANKYFSSQNKGKSYGFYYGKYNNFSEENENVFIQKLIEKIRNLFFRFD